VRGLQVIHAETDGAGKTFTVVKGWKADSAEGAKKIAADLSSDEQETKTAKNGKAVGEVGGKKPKAVNKEIEGGSATSGDAADFFPNKKKK